MYQLLVFPQSISELVKIICRIESRHSHTGNRRQSMHPLHNPLLQHNRGYPEPESSLPACRNTGPVYGTNLQPCHPQEKLNAVILSPPNLPWSRPAPTHCHSGPFTAEEATPPKPSTHSPISTCLTQKEQVSQRNSRQTKHAHTSPLRSHIAIQNLLTEDCLECPTRLHASPSSDSFIDPQPRHSPSEPSTSGPQHTAPAAHPHKHLARAKSHRAEYPSPS